MTETGEVTELSCMHRFYTRKLSKHRYTLTSPPNWITPCLNSMMFFHAYFWSLGGGLQPARNLLTEITDQKLMDCFLSHLTDINTFAGEAEYPGG